MFMIPERKFLVGPMVFSGPFKGPINFNLQGDLVAPTDGASLETEPWISFQYIDQLTINGGGSLDGQGTGDDYVSIGPGSRDINVTNVQCGPGHGISIGSLGAGPNEDDVIGVHVTYCNLTNTMYGVRIKTFVEPYQSTVSNIVYDQINPHYVGNPIIIDQQYNPYQKSNEDK
ncbi:hypothetical protein EZV62_008711 [Acer yangbiense]|uniref:Polygalacturonase n=1 Tax=Acer yangbiense TaxID=1000413 RepID=A0A5C7IG56_9ROSI|nr:hypothetical protein EZV62_008711 [Acer yangbiense]